MPLKLILLLSCSLLLTLPLSAALSPQPEVPLTAQELRQQIREHRQMERASLSRSERRAQRRERRRELRQTLRDFRRGEVDGETVLYAIIALLLPPLAVYLAEGQVVTGNLYLNLLLVLGAIVLTIILGSFLWFIPAIVHALLVVFGSI
ncbi:MAG: YqaE/Pmp3 family membrane protein [Bacteroidota bacterium]